MRVAYVTADSCGAGHAVRGVALVRAARRAGVELRAFGPPKPDLVEPEYEGSNLWATDVLDFGPDLLLGDLDWIRLDALRAELGAPAWLLLRYMPCGHLADRGRWRIDRWERRISIEPLSETLVGTTHAVPPVVVDVQRFTPTDGQELRAGYNTWWEAVWFGYRDRVQWVSGGSPERQSRIDLGGEMTANGADELLAMIR
jgi:hypothetical protein